MDIIGSILEVFTEIGTWLVSAVTLVLPIFYSAESGLTILGVLAVAALAFSVMFLVIGIIQKFLHFRG